MSEKSHVGMLITHCPICAAPNGKDSILLDRRLRDTLDRESHIMGTTDDDACPSCAALLAEDRIAIIGTTLKDDEAPDSMNAKDLPRSGAIAWIKRDRWHDMFNVDPPRGSIAVAPQQVIELLEQRVLHEEEPDAGLN